jgi:Double-stranded RNA binding motif
MMPHVVHHHPYYWARSIPPPPPEVYNGSIDPPPPPFADASFAATYPPPPLISTRRIDKRRGRQSDNESSSSGGARHRTFSKKKKPSASLLGKTGVAALFEWCSPRQWTPVFDVVPVMDSSEEFACTVYLQDAASRTEWGRGRGRNKHAAKQESARRALQALLPGGAVFDEETGMLMALPSPKDPPWPAADDLAPHLAKQLAIGRNHDENEEVTGAPPKRTYPTGETSSEDDSSSSVYYASRGASVCSVLLHTIIQIDKARIVDTPTFSYQVMSSSASMPPASNTTETQRRKSPTVARFLRGSFQCTAQLKIRDAAEERRLTAVGVGGTKRDARHVASAKLLSLLFPECQDDMAQVKKAAETMRDQYAAARSKSTAAHECNVPPPWLPLAQAGDPPIPAPLLHWLSHESRNAEWDAALVFRQWSRQKQRDRAVEAALQACNDGDDADVGRTVLRRAVPEDLSRIKKLLRGTKSDRAIHRATAPRRGDAAPSGPHHYLSELSSTLADVSIMDRSNHSVPSDGSDMISRLWSSPSTIVLLLCRAITEDPPLGCAVLTLGFSMEDPVGKILRLVELASEPHLPQERFMDCLQNFAKCMNCALVGHEKSNSKGRNADDGSYRLQTRDLWAIIESYTKKHSRSEEVRATPPASVGISTNPPPLDVRKTGNCYQASNGAGLSHLQSVQEESEVSEDEEDSRSGNESPSVKANALKPSAPTAPPNGGRSVKPSKRSRFK